MFVYEIEENSCSIACRSIPPKSKFDLVSFTIPRTSVVKKDVCVGFSVYLLLQKYIFKTLPVKNYNNSTYLSYWSSESCNFNVRLS